MRFLFLRIGLRPYGLLGLLGFLFCVSCSRPSSTVLVRTVDEFNSAVADAGPGSTIVMANGVWTDSELLFEGTGTQSSPITLRAEEKGQVLIQGQSNLRLSGAYLHVEGLVFSQGYSPTSEVISFRKDKNALAHNSRLTECVIDDFSKPIRQDSDYWIGVYGKNNRIDHNHFSTKRNKGVTLAVRLDSPESRQNDHRIDHNYFGPRPTLGSNGGETLRIGTSRFSKTFSNTIVESNYFDRCNGEVEIISNKSCGNIYRNNVFFESRGTLTLRHGENNLVDSNVFIGNRKPNTGGIRIINADQTVTNNYASGLTGHRFGGALVLMNGIYNSPINRYDQAKNIQIRNNTFINCDHVQLCAGADEERSAPPVNSIMENNMFYHTSKSRLFTVYDDIQGIEFRNNILSEKVESIDDSGFVHRKTSLKRDKNGLLWPDSHREGIGATPLESLLTKEETGVSWYPKESGLGEGSQLSIQKVEPGHNTLYEAIKSADSETVFELKGGAVYSLSKIISVTHSLRIQSQHKDRAILVFESERMFELQNGGNLILDGLDISGENSPSKPGNAVVQTSEFDFNTNYTLQIENCVFRNLNKSKNFDAIRVFKNTFADTLRIANSSFNGISGHVVALDKEVEDKGIYNVEYVQINNNSFTNIGGVALRLYRGGKDESTFGPVLEMSHNVFDQVGKGPDNAHQAAVDLYGVQKVHFSENIFNHSSGLKMQFVVGEPEVRVLRNNFYRSGKLSISGNQDMVVEDVWECPPMFKSTSSYELQSTSQLKGKGKGGVDLGLILNTSPEGSGI